MLAKYVTFIYVTIFRSCMCSTGPGAVCLGDITFVMEYKNFPFTDPTNCNCDGKLGSYFVGSCCWCYSCWDPFYDHFLDELGDVSGVKVNLYVSDASALRLYDCTFDLPNLKTTRCRTECWNARTISNTPRIPDVGGVVVLVVERGLSHVMEDVVSSLPDGGAVVVVVGVGNDVSRRELLPLATDENRLVMVEHRNKLQESVSEIRQKACNCDMSERCDICYGLGNTGSQEELRALATSSNVSFTLENWSSLTGLIPELRHLVCHDMSLQRNDVACESRTDTTLLVDLSHSMTGYVPSMKTFLTTFLKTLSVTVKDQHVTLITFSSNVKVVVENSVNISDILAAINDLKPQMGVSDLTGALTEAFYVVKRSPRLYMDTGQSCPALAALILSDGLSQSRSDVLKAATNLKRVGVRISLLSFGVESTVYENEAITSNRYTFHSFNRSMNSTLLNELHSDIVNVSAEAAKGHDSAAESNCSYKPANVTFIFNVQSEDLIQTYVGEFVNFTKPLSNHPRISVLHPFHISSTLPNDVRSHKTVSSTLLEMLEEVKFPTDVNGATCVIIVSDEKVTAPAPLFRQIWRLADTGSKVMSVGVGDDVNNYVTERIASVPRYAFSSRSVWDIDIPQNMWNRYCEACGFTPDIDLVFLVEASTQTFSPWNDVLNFLIGASDTFPVGRHNVMVSVVTFGQQTVSQIRFNSYTTKMELFRSIHSLQPRRGPADLATVLQDVDSLFAGARGGRPEAKKVAVLVMAQMITRVISTGEDTQVILLDIGAKRNHSPSKFLKSSDIYIQTRGADGLARYRRDLRGIVCSNER
ncbi:collagen alpha-5(VI) chain-like [Haliotis cracherodii]|uniref:collagen alpha-5(VI) chain-like n=1 Tax=Haliotis cracherodii TaxID=6455 RepID=UPI0039E9A6C3